MQNVTKRNTIVIIIGIAFLSLLFLWGCKKDSGAKLTTLAKPNWHVDSAWRFTYTMTAVVKLSDSLQRLSHDQDELAVFEGNECRGAGTRVLLDSGYVYYILIKGYGTEPNNLSFKYYYSNFSYLYQTDTILPFVIDGSYGSIGHPLQLNLKVVNQ